MTVICFVDGGSTGITRVAVQLLSQAPGWGTDQIGHLRCYRNSDEPIKTEALDLSKEPLSSRELIAGVRDLQRRHEHVVLDASGTSDKTIALAVALSEVTITPLSIDVTDHGAFTHAIDLVRAVSENLRRPKKHCIFLATRQRIPFAATLPQISGLLATKGLVTLPMPLCVWNHETHASDSARDLIASGHSSFAYSIFDLINRQFTPVARQLRFG